MNTLFQESPSPLTEATTSRIFELNIPLLIAHLIALVAIIVFLFIFVRKPFSAWLDRIAKKNAEDQKRIEDTISENESLKSSLDNQLQEAILKKNMLLDDTRNQAYQQKKKILSEANREGRSLIEQSRKEAEMRIERAEKSVQESIIKNSLLLSEKILKKKLSKSDHKELVKEFIKDLNVTNK